MCEHAFAYGPEFACAVDETRKIVLQSRPIYDPDHVAIEALTRGALFGAQVRILEFDDHSIGRTHIRYVLFPFRVVQDALVPGFRKSELPRPMPLRFRLPPSVARTFPDMRPMMDPLRATSCDDSPRTNRTRTSQSRRRRRAHILYVSPKHGSLHESSSRKDARVCSLEVAWGSARSA